MVLKRVPSSRGAFGVHWTQWFFPSLAASAIYRKFFKPTALALDIAERERILRRLSMAYMLLGWTMVGGVFYYFVGPVAEEEQLDSEGKRVAPALKHSIRLVDPGDLKKGSKVSMIQVGGPYGWSFEKKARVLLTEAYPR